MTAHSKSLIESFRATYAFNQRKLFTVVFILDRPQRRLLMGEKLRGFGMGTFNGFGGKVDFAVDASVADAAARELEEECGATLEHGAQSLLLRGVILGKVDSDPRLHEVNVYTVDLEHVTAAIVASEEMRPQWFDFDDVPFDKMFANAPLWLPHILTVPSGSGRAIFLSAFQFAKGLSEIAEHEITSLPSSFDMNELVSGTFMHQQRQYNQCESRERSIGTTGQT